MKGIFLEQSRDFERVFTRTLRALGELERAVLVRDFHNEMRSGMGLHFFPMFLRQNKKSPACFEIAQIEWMMFQFSQSLVSQNPTIKSGNAGVYRLNPMAHCFYLSFPIEEFALLPGLWGFVAARNERGFDAKSMGPLHASLLDLIIEGVVMDEQTLLELSREQEQTRSFGIEEARQSLRDLLAWGLIENHC